MPLSRLEGAFLLEWAPLIVAYHVREKNLDYTVRSQISDGLRLASGAKNAVTEFFQDRGAMPTDNTQAGMSLAGEIQGKYVTSVSVGNQDGVITVTYGNDANAPPPTYERKLPGNLLR